MNRDYKSDVNSIVSTPWDTSETIAIPSTEDVKLAGGAKWIVATYLYADLANSSKMARELDRRITAKIIKCFLQSSTHLVGQNGGKVISFDGDRILALFVGESNNTNAAECALNISWLVSAVIRPTFEKRYEAVRDASFKIGHGVGVDTGRALIVRGGVRGNNDLISIGRAPNLAAKLSDLRGDYTSRISADVYYSMNKSVKFAKKDGSPMWEEANWTFLEDKLTIFRSNWWRMPS